MASNIPSSASSSSADPTEKWRRHYTAQLSEAVAHWANLPMSERLLTVKQLARILYQCLSSSTNQTPATSNICLLTLHTFSHLLSRDSASDNSFTHWTRHAKFSEELIVSLLQLFHLCSSSLSTFPIVEKEHRFSFAYLIAQLNSMAVDETALPIRRNALLALVAMANVIQPSLLAAFFPGMVSSTLAILTKSPQLHSSLALIALNLLTIIISRALKPSKKTPASISEKLDLLSLSSTPKPKPSSSKTNVKTAPTTPNRLRPRLPNSLDYNPTKLQQKLSRDSSLRIPIDSDDWISKTTNQLLPRLKSIVTSRQGPRFHSMASVRIAYVRFLSFVVEQDHVVLDDVHVSFFKMALFECCIHPYLTVSQLAVDILRRLFKTHGRIHFERAIIACVRFANHHSESSTQTPIDIDVDSLKQLAATSNELDHFFLRVSVNDNKDGFPLMIFLACLAVLIPVQQTNETDPTNNEDLFVIPLARLQAFMHRVGVIPFVDLLLALHRRLWKPSRVDREAAEEALDNHIIQFAHRLGSVGLLPCVYDPLIALASTGSMQHVQVTNSNSSLSSAEAKTGIFPKPPSFAGSGQLARDDGPDMDMDMNSYKIRAHSTLILQAIIEATLKKTIDNSRDQQEADYTKQCAKEVIDVMSRLFIPNSQYHHVDESMITLKISLLSRLSSLFTLLSGHRSRKASYYHRQAYVGSDVILVALMHILRDATHGDPIVQPIAIDVLAHVAKCDGSDSYRILIQKHINFIVSRVIWHLDQPWAVNVLKFVVGPTPDDVGTEASLLLNKTLKSICDTMSAVSDERAIQMLSSIKAVLSIAVIQKQTLIKHDDTDSRNKADSDGIDKDLLEVHRVLFPYCTEEKWNDDDEKLMELSKVIDSNRVVPGNDLFDGFGDDNDENKDNNEGHPEGREQPDLNVSSFEDIAQHALTGTRDLLIGRSWHVRAAALECISLGVQYLKHHKKLLFPHVAKLLPLLPSQLDCIGSRQESLLTSGERMYNAMKQRRSAKRISDIVYELNDKASHLPVITHTCQCIASLAECAGVFIRDRFIRLIYPKLIPLLDIVTHFPTLVVAIATNSQEDIVPSHGTMTAADAVLHAFASIAQFTPATLVSYTSTIIRSVAPLLNSDKFHPETVAEAYPSRFQNQNLLRAEIERWEQRVECVSRIIRGLIIANESETLCTLLCVDPHAPHVLESGHNELANIYIR